MTRECRRVCWRDTLGRIAPPISRLRLAASPQTLITSNLLLLLLISTLVVSIASSERDNRATRSRRTYHPTFSRSLLSSTSRDGIRSAGRPTVRPSPVVPQDDTADDTFDDAADAIKESGSARMAVRVGRGGEDGGANGKRQEMLWLRRGMAAARGESRVVEAVASGSSNGGSGNGGSSIGGSSSGGSSSGGSSNDGSVPLWWNINRLYYDRDMNYISGSVTVRGEVEDAGYSQGTVLLDSAVDTIIRNAVTSNQLPFDRDGVYFVLSDETVDQVSDGLAFCSDYCGWHWYTKVPGQGLLVSSWVGNAGSKCRSSCISSQLFSGPGHSPNGDVGMDGLLSVFAHELAEATSDPFMSAWFDSDGEENADKCSWEFGDMLFDSIDGPFYNLVGLNNQKFLIQQNWNLVKGTCATTVSYANLASSTTPPPQQGSGGGIGRLIGRIIGGKG